MGQEHQFSSGTNGKVTVGATSTLVSAPKSNRVYALLVNDSDETIYIALGAAAVLNQGIPLFASGGSLTLDGKYPFKGAIYAISTSGTKNLSYFDA